MRAAPSSSDAAVPMVLLVITASLALLWGWLKLSAFALPQLGFLVALSPLAQDVLFNCAIFGGILLLAMAFRRWRGIAAPRAGGLPAWTGLAAISAGALGVAAAAALVPALGGSIDDRATVPSLALLAGVPVIFLQAYAEELFFRGWLQPQARALLPTSAALIVTTALFALFHLIVAGPSAIGLLNIALAGLWFGLLSLASETILLPALAHFAWNATEELGLGLMPNPGIGNYGAWFDLDLQGPAVAGASAEGLNGGLGATAVLLSLVAATASLVLRGAPAAASVRGVERDGAEPAVGDGAPAILTWSGLSETGNVRSHNEDTLLALPRQGVWAVADGMGGLDKGDWAAKAVTDAIEDAVRKASPGEIVNACRQAIGRTNREIHASSLLGDSRIGTTIAMLVLEEDRFHVLWAGDSRVYRLRHGQLERLTRDHSSVQDLIDRGLITPAEALGHPLAHVLTHAVGVSAQLQPGEAQGTVAVGDCFVLCTDGLHGVVSDAEICAIIGAEDSEPPARRLLERACMNRTRDNVTIAVIEMGEAAAPARISVKAA